MDIYALGLEMQEIEYLEQNNFLGDDCMPFIDSKVTVKMTKEKQESIKQQLGKAISIFNKSESYLMVGFEDNYNLYFAGEELEKGAFIDVSLFGKSSDEAYDKMTEQICNIFEKELGIPKNKIYVKYEETNHWGWNGRNF